MPKAGKYKWLQKKGEKKEWKIQRKVRIWGKIKRKSSPTLRKMKLKIDK
jgi:hypothetical protein